jgi:hypothetical protein
MIIFYIAFPGGKKEPKLRDMLNNVKFIVTHCYNLYCWIFLVSAVYFFRRSALTQQRQAYLEYKNAFWTQIAGILQVILFNSFMDILFMFKLEVLNPGKSPHYLWLLMGQILGFYIFVIFKEPRDLFSIFTKRPDVKFSIWQIAQTSVTDKKLELDEAKKKLT